MKKISIILSYFLFFSCNNKIDYEFIINKNDFVFEQTGWETNCQKIYGKWELIAKGHSLDKVMPEEPDSYFLYGENHTIQRYDYLKKQLFNENLYRVDSLLYIIDVNLDYGYESILWL